MTNSATETFKFNAEVGKVLNLVINSIYTNRDIFLRELISNASDAIDKLKYEGMKNQALLEKDHEYKIHINLDRENNAIVIRDTGIGMNKDDLISYLGTIASSGTQKFMESMKATGNGNQDLIGQFGVGFYSSFIVADKVSVKTKKAGEERVYVWKSEGIGDFTISDAEDATFNTGTEITLYLKDGKDREDYLDKFRVENIIKTYSNHISVPIILEHEQELSYQVNTLETIWHKTPSSVTAEEYKGFYKTLAWTPDEPFLTIHNRIEGAVEFVSLLFIPSAKPFDLYSPEKKTNVKLYVKKVFITENNTNLLPEYLRFVRGVVDSADLPLNISRETFQNNQVIDKISTSLVKKILGELRRKMESEPEKYLEFWKIFGNVLKEGLCRPDDYREQLLQICRFYSTKIDNSGTTTIDEYVSRMKPDQDTIYYITASNYDEAMSSPQLEVFKKKDIEVLLLTDTVDDFWVNVVLDYKGKNIKSVATSDATIDSQIEEKSEKDETKNEDASKNDKLIKCFKNILRDEVKDVKISHKLIGSPVCLSQEAGGMSIRMERYLVEQKQLPKVSKKILEINPNNEILGQILDKISVGLDGEYSAEVKNIVMTLFDCACLMAGDSIGKPNEFSNRVFGLIK